MVRESTKCMIDYVDEDNINDIRTVIRYIHSEKEEKAENEENLSRSRNITSKDRFLKFIREYKKGDKLYHFNHDELTWVINNFKYVKKFLEDKEDMHDSFYFLYDNDFCVLDRNLKEFSKIIPFLRVARVFYGDCNFIVYMKLMLELYNEENLELHIGDGYFRILIISIFFDDVDVFKMIYPHVWALSKFSRINDIETFTKITKIFRADKILDYYKNKKPCYVMFRYRYIKNK